MKFKIFTMLVTLGILSIMPMIYMGKFDPVALIDSGFDFDVKQYGQKSIKKVSAVVTDEKVHVYKWRDENGVMQFSSERPPTVTEAEHVELNPNANLMQAANVPVEEEVSVEAEPEAPSPYSMKGMKKVMNDAKGIEKMLQQREDAQQEMLNNI